MARRGENIRKRKDGRWEGRIKLSKTSDGKIIYKSIYGKTYTEVKEKMLSYKNNEVHLEVDKSNDFTFGELVGQWKKVNSLKNKGTTDYKYGYLIDRHIMPVLKDVKIGEINAGILNEFLAEKLLNGRIDKKGGLSPSYVRTMMIIINSTLNYSHEMGYSKFVKAKCGAIPVIRNSPKTLTITSQQKLETYISNHLNETTIGILLALRAGLRVGEVCALKWDDVDFDEKILHVRNTVTRTHRKTKNVPPFELTQPKTKSSIRDIPLTEFLMYALIKVKSKSNYEYVVSEKESFISPNTFEYRYHKVLFNCGIGDINFHALRHTFATRCIEAGVDDKTLSEILGHSNVSITLNTYVHSSMSLKRTQLEKLSELMKDN